MQPLIWYYRRLKSMGPEELVWRLGSAARNALDKGQYALGRFPSYDSVQLGFDPDAWRPGFRLCDQAPGAWATAGGDEEEWCGRVTQRAERIARHRFSFFDLVDHDMGAPIDWHRDHSSGKHAPRIFAPLIDYRDFTVTGDCKLVWEPNRHHQLVVLARAYRASGELRWAQAVRAQLGSWLDQNPYGRGMNWRSPLELGVRLISWVWALDLIHESGVCNGDFRTRLLRAVYLHCREITRKYSRGSSANNHLVGEAAGVFVASCYFPQLDTAGRWRAESRDILVREIEAQTYPDGCTREQALGYQLFVLQFYLACALAGRAAGSDFPPSYWSALERMMVFLAAIAAGGERLPLFGDRDDGYVLDLGAAPDDARAWLAVGAVLFERGDLACVAGRYSEPARWLLGAAGRSRFQALQALSGPEALASQRFPDSGYCLLQCGSLQRRDAVSVMFDCGELGFGAIAAHGHADALSFTLRVGGADVFVDPGTYDYFTHPEWRAYFRSTRAHNTVTVDGADQSLMLGPFLWGRRAGARCLRWEPDTAGGGLVSGEHDGYAHLDDPVVHRRTLSLDAAARTLTIEDELEAEGTHEVCAYFHLAEDCAFKPAHGGVYDIAVAGRTIHFMPDPAFTVTVLRGSLDPIGGWVSRGYHRKTPATTLVASARCRGRSRFLTRIALDGGDDRGAAA